MRIAKPGLGNTTVVDPDTGEEKVDTYRTSKVIVPEQTVFR